MLRRNTKEKGDCKDRHPPWGVSVLRHRLGIPVLGTNVEETSPLGWLEDHRDKEKGWRSLDSTCEERSSDGLTPRQGRGKSALEAA